MINKIINNTKNGFKKETTLVHGGYTPDSNSNSCAVPIYQTTAYHFESSQHAADLFALNQTGNIYSRLQNPTTTILEKRITSLENGIGTLATASGLSAISLAILNIAQSGDHIIASQNLYGGTHNLLKYTLKRFGITTSFIPMNDTRSLKDSIKSKTKAIFTESIGNPGLEIADIKTIADIAHENHIPLIVDNTTSPYILQPIKHHADIVVYSATKFICGHGTAMGGLIIDSGNFNWTNEKFPLIAGPDPEFHNVDFNEKFKSQGNIAYISKARLALMRDLGPVISPFNSFLLLQGLETLHLRMAKHCENALITARYLEKHPMVEWINYPGLDSSPQKELREKYLPDGAGSIIGFGIKGGLDAAKHFIDNLELISHAANIGDAKTLAIHPAGTTHHRLTPEEQKAAGVTPDFIRLSIGIENIDDICHDIEKGLFAAKKTPQSVAKRDRKE